MQGLRHKKVNIINFKKSVILSYFILFWSHLLRLASVFGSVISNVRGIIAYSNGSNSLIKGYQSTHITVFRPSKYTGMSRKRDHIEP